MLLIGDLNHTPDTKEYKLWLDAGWTDTFAKVGKGEGLTIKADKPTRRIDYVMAAGPIAEQVIESRPLFEGAFRTNPADPTSFALSDHLPQLAVFEKEKGKEKGKGKRGQKEKGDMLLFRRLAWPASGTERGFQA